MDKKEAIDYLKRKGIKNPSEEEIRKVMKEGKIYGDPLVKLN